jgi:hypothetical protein
MWNELTLVASKPNPLPVDDVVWQEMLKYYAIRIKRTYVPKLKRNFRTCPAILVSPEDTHMDSSLAEIETLRQLIFSVNDMDLSLEDLNRFVLKAHKVRNSSYAKTILLDSNAATNGSMKLWESIYFLGRLRSAFERMTRVLQTFPSFEKVRFVPLPKANATAPSLNNPLGLEKTLRLLGLNMSSVTVQNILGPGWTIKGARKKFAELQGQQLHVHAEVQMLLHLCSTSDLHARTYHYIGSSKKSCFMCWSLLRTHSIYSTRGSHGRLYSRWTVPEYTDLAADQAKILGMTLIQVQESLVKKLGSEFQEFGPMQKTSVVGGNSVVNDGTTVEGARSSQLLQRENALAQQRIALSFER